MRQVTDEKALEILTDLANALEAAAVNVKQQVAEIMNITEEEAWDPEKVKWTKAQGPHGEYEKSTARSSENPHFQGLLKALKAHNGKLTKSGLFYWLFKNGNVIGRKKR